MQNTQNATETQRQVAFCLGCTDVPKLKVLFIKVSGSHYTPNSHKKI